MIEILKDTLQNTIADITHQTLGKIRHEDTNPNTQRTGKTEDDVRDYEALEVQVGLGNVQTQTEGNDCLMDHDGDDDGQELSCVVLEADGDSLEN